MSYQTVRRYSGTPTTAGDGNALVVAQGAGIKIRVLALIIHCGVAGDTATLKSAAAAISHPMVLLASQVVCLPFCEEGWYETVANEALNLNLVTGSDVGVTVLWCQAT